MHANPTLQQEANQGTALSEQESTSQFSGFTPPPFQLKCSPSEGCGPEEEEESRQLKAAPFQMKVVQRQEGQGDPGDGNATVLFQAKTRVRLNVRSGPATSFDPPLETLNADTNLEVFETKDGWYRVGPSRWVSGSNRFVERLPQEEAPEPQAPEPSPEEKISEAQASYQAGDIDMIGLAKALNPYAGSHGSAVLRVMDSLPGAHRDNLAYAMANNVDDGGLANFNPTLLNRMHSELSGYFNTTNWQANWAMAERIARVQGGGSSTGGQQENAGGQTDSTGEQTTGEQTGTANSEFATLWAKDRLTTEEIATVRVHIDAMPEGAEKQQYYEELQEKVTYVNQRNVGGYAGERYFGGSCNLASLAMAMSYLGLGIPSKYQEMDGFPSSNVVEQLEFIRRTEGAGARTTMGGWNAVAEAVGAKKTDLLFQQIKDRNWFESTVRDSHIRAGHAIMCSIHGHIVRIQGMNDSGIVVDDPYGESILKAGTERGWGKINDTDREDLQNNANGNNWGAHRLGHGNVGEDHDWPWADVEASSFNWIVAFEKA